MSQITIELVTNDPLAATGISRTTEGGRLKSLAFTGSFGTGTKGMLWLEVGTRLGGVGDEFITSVFFCGTVTQRDRVLWTGDYPFEPYEQLYVKCVSLILLTARITGKIEKGDP